MYDADDLAEMCNDAGIVAVFECKAMFFGLLGLKPRACVVITAKALQFLAGDNLVLTFRMGHVKETRVDFQSATVSLIMISVTRQCAAKIGDEIKSAENVDLLADDKNFTSDTITLVCEKLPGSTTNVLRILLPRMSDIESETTTNILQALGYVPLNNTSETVTKFKSSSLLRAQNQTNSCHEHVNKDVTRLEQLAENTMLTEFITDATLESSQTPIPITTSTYGETTDTDFVPPQPCDDNRVLLTYNYGDGAISISVGDYMCLTSKQFLNDKIIDFYLKYIQNNVIRTDDRKKVHIFSSFFYHVLTTSRDGVKSKTDSRTEAQRRYDRVTNWTKNVNIFEKDFLIVPINERSHWYVVVVCFANMLMPVDADDNNCNNNNEQGDSIIKQPVILIFNSMASTTNYRPTTILREYLTCEYTARKLDSLNPPNFTKDTLPGHSVKVPQQNNLFDCGLFVLQYVEEFFRKPIKDFRVPINQLKNWFDPIDIVRKRENIARLIENMINEHHQMMGTTSKIKLPNIPFPTLNGELVAEELIDVDNFVEMTEIIL